ncbi:hypothetical protein PG985_001394 [Apiospora marii]|uniref:Uncharacterized protein n=1 Tax=Apiospora marii TaxID=335849 RepID=A0ABR1RHT1_9PEZI
MTSPNRTWLALSRARKKEKEFLVVDATGYPLLHRHQPPPRNAGSLCSSTRDVGTYYRPVADFPSSILVFDSPVFIA